MSAFAYDLGVFDPTFPGITLHYPNEAALEARRRVDGIYVAIAIDQIRETNPARAPEDIGQDEILGQMQRMSATGLPLGQEEKEALGQRFMAKDPDGAVLNLAIATAVEHERRHFHDWLLSPYMAAMTAMRVEICINAYEAHSFLRAQGANVIPVPLTRWLRKTPSEQEQLFGMWRSLVDPSIDLRLPDFGHPTFGPAVDAIAQRYASIGVLFESIGDAAGLSASAMFEASAILIQTQAIHDLFGPTACNVFLSTMAEQNLGSRYPWFIRIMSSFARPGEALENNTMLALATWCLLGSTTTDGDNAHPVTRMSHVIGYLKAHGLPASDAPASDVFNALDRSSGAVPWATCLTESVRLGDEVVKTFEPMLAEEGVPTFVVGAVQAYAFLHDLHTYMVGVFLEDPDRYTKPTEYLDTNLERWPEPPMRQTFGRPFFRVKEAELDKYARATCYRERSGEHVFLQQFIARHPKETVHLQLADNWQYLCAFADTLFAEFNRDQPEINWQKDRERGRGLYLFEVLT